MNFLGEIKVVNMRKTSSGDIEYKIIFITNNPAVLSLAALKPEQYVKVSVNKPDESEPA